MTFSRKQQQRDMAILHLLCALPTHPYDVEQQLAALGNTWSTHRGIIRYLKLVQAEGLATSAWQTPTNGRARLIYAITEAGLAYLQRMAMSRF